jgi:putative ABC transport system permease protein
MTMLHDLRFALRLHLKRPLFTLIAVLCLALGIGVNVTIFGWFSSTVLNPLQGVARSGELVIIDGLEKGERTSVKYSDYLEYRLATGVFQNSCGADMRSLGIRHQERTEAVQGQIVTGDFFGTMEVGPALGRTLTPQDCRRGQPLVAVLSHDYWVRRFLSDPGIVGQSVLLQGSPCTIVGVAKAGFHGSMSGLAMACWVPLEPYLDATQASSDRNPDDLNDIFARLKPGVSLSQASDRVLALSKERAHQRTDNRDLEAYVYPITENRHGIHGVLRAPMLILGFAAAFLFLVACSNVANLILARGAERQGEFALRLALGGSKGRLISQVMMEGLLLGLAGGLVGLLAAWASQRVLLGFMPPTNFRMALDPHLGGTAIAFAFGLSLLTCLLVSVLPALLSSNVKLASAMKEGGSKESQSIRQRRMMSALIVVELTLATLLLTLTGHVIHTMKTLQAAPTGFGMKNQLVAGIDFAASDLESAKRPLLIQDLLLRARQLPGVVSASAGFTVPRDFSGFYGCSFIPEGQTFAKGAEPKGDWNPVFPDYFRTLGIPLLQGREFNTGDAAGSEPVAIVDQRLARRFWPGQDPIGKRMRMGSKELVNVVGVVRDIKHSAMGPDRGYTVFQPFTQNPMSSIALHLHTEGSPWSLVAPLRTALADLAPSLPLAYTRELVSFHEGAQFPLRIAAQILGFLGLVTLLLATVGTYGLISHATTRRSREFGIRLSLGATPGNLYRLVVGQGARLAGIAFVLGLAGALALGKAMASLITELGAVDPWVIIGVTLILASVTLLALSIPAWRAAFLEPSKALRDE